LRVFIGGIGLGSIQEIRGGLLINGVGGEPGRNGAEGFQGIARDEDINLVGRRILNRREDTDGLNSLAVIGGNAGVLPIVVDPLLLFGGFRKVNA
jgi:hypothetical protein